MNSDHLLSLAALASFALAGAAAIAGFWVGAFKRRGWQFVLAGAGALFKTLAIGAACRSSDKHFFNSSSEIFGLMAWSLGLSYLLALAVSQARSLGALVLPLIVLLLAVSLFSARGQVPLNVPNTSLFAVHILCAFLGYGLFLSACGASVLYLEQASLLKRKIFGSLFQDLPGLQELERLEMLCSRLGLLLFTAALSTGALLVKTQSLGFWLEPKTLAAEITWLIFAVLVAGRALRWLNGRSAAKVALAGAGLVLLTFALAHPLAQPLEKSAVQSTDRTSAHSAERAP